MYGSRFDTNIGKPLFEKLLRRLKKYTGWESVTSTKDMVYTSDSHPLRLTIDDATDKQTLVNKKKVYKNDFTVNGKPLDVRFAVATEDPASAEVEYTRVRQRVRTSFLRKNVRIDATITSGDPSDMDCEEPETYHLEVEIVDPKKVDCFYNVVYKIQDILDICN